MKNVTEKSGIYLKLLWLPCSFN